MSKNIGPITLFEAWLGQSIESYMVESENSIEARKKEIKDKFSWLEIKVDGYDEDGDEETLVFSISDEKDVIEAHESAIDLIDDLTEALKEKTLLSLEVCTTCESLFEHCFGWEVKKRDLGLAICQYSDHEGLNENHLLLAKNDKEIFEKLFMSQYNAETSIVVKTKP